MHPSPLPQMTLQCTPPGVSLMDLGSFFGGAPWSGVQGPRSADICLRAARRPPAEPMGHGPPSPPRVGTASFLTFSHTNG